MKTKEIAEWLSAELVGDGDVEITGFAALDRARPGEISFSTEDRVVQTNASAVIVSPSAEGPADLTLLRIDNPKLAFAQLAEVLSPPVSHHGRHPSAVISELSSVDAEYIGANVSIGDNCAIERGCQIHAGVRIGNGITIGENSIIHPNCVIYDGSVIGANSTIHAGTVLGSDGFGYVTHASGHQRFPQAGTLVIEDNVEIGANCTIDRGSLGETRIGEGTKIDNLVHIAHNVVIGKRVLIAGQSGIAGSSTIEDDVVIAGQVGIADHVTVKSGAIIGAKSSVFPNKILRRGFWSGIPVEPVDQYRRKHAMINRMLRQSEDDE